MRILSAVDAVSPAIERTRQVLFGKRSLSTFFKIACVATLAAMGDGLNFRLNSSSNHLNNYGHMPPQMTAFLAAIVAFAVLIGIVFLVVFLVLFYIGNRMQFVLFDMVLTRRTEVRPPWRLYASRTWRWIGTKILLFFAALLLSAIAALPVLLNLLRMHREHTGFHAASFFGVMAGTAVLVLLILAVFFVLSAMLHDFVLPAVALEDAPVFSTIGRLRALVKAEPGQIAIYMLLRIAFAICMAIATVIAIVLVAIVAGIVLGLIGLVAFLLLHKLGIAGMVLLGVVIAIEALLFIALMIAADVVIVGLYMTFQQAWALYFLGGRYTLLGNLLEPPLEAMPTAWPPAPVAEAWPPPIA
jgi:hypothetical protein